MMKLKEVFLRGTSSARVIQVIKTSTLIGQGTEEHPYRELIQYWDFKGNKLAESDPIDSQFQIDL